MTLQRSTRARLTTGIVLTLVLGAGVVLGVALDRQLEARAAAESEGFRRDGGRPGPDGRRWGPDQRGKNPERGPGEGRDSTRRRPSLIVEEVGLTEGQRAQADSIYWHYRAQMRALHEEFDEAYSTRYREIMAQSREDMLGILTPDQRVVYDSLLVVWERRRQERQDSSSTNTGGRRKP